MEKETKKVEGAQGAETTETTVETKSKRTGSPLYVIKGFGEHVKRVEEGKLLPVKELNELKVLHQKMIGYYMGEPML